MQSAILYLLQVRCVIALNLGHLCIIGYCFFLKLLYFPSGICAFHVTKFIDFPLHWCILRTLSHDCITCFQENRLFPKQIVIEIYLSQFSIVSISVHFFLFSLTKNLTSHPGKLLLSRVCFVSHTALLFY